ncbi:hypothetical protein F5Y03DRAFT_182601, partial [Xylaria venustula]
YRPSAIITADLFLIFQSPVLFISFFALAFFSAYLFFLLMTIWWFGLVLPSEIVWYAFPVHCLLVGLHLLILVWHTTLQGF